MTTTKPIKEPLRNGWKWLRIASADWADPLDPEFSKLRGGRWNPPSSHETLYFNQDIVTARFNLRLFVQGQGYEPEDLEDQGGPILITATLPRNQIVADAHTPQGLKSLNLPNSYPLDSRKRRIGWKRCQAIGLRVKKAALRGLLCRSAEFPDRAGRELAWFPASTRSRAKLRRKHAFAEWYW